MLQRDINQVVVQAWHGKFHTIAGLSSPAPRVRNPQSQESAFWRGYALARTCLNREILANIPRSSSVLEVGVDNGVQLRCLSSLGFHHLAGTHVHFDVLRHARHQAPGAAGVQASALHLPFAGASFDLVCTSGLLANLCDGRMERFMHELHRCTRRWIWGWERLEQGSMTARNHFTDEPSMDLATAWRDAFKDLRVLRSQWMPTPMPGGGFQTYLLEKIG